MLHLGCVMPNEEETQDGQSNPEHIDPIEREIAEMYRQMVEIGVQTLTSVVGSQAHQSAGTESTERVDRRDIDG